MTIKVMLADDHRMFREALKVPLEQETDILVIGESSSGAETLATLENLQPDVLVIDIGMPDINGIEIARQVTDKYPDIRIVALSGYSDRLYVHEMLKAGALAYVLKSSGADELVSAIRLALNGKNFLSQELISSMMRVVSGQDVASTAPPTILGKREKEVLSLLASGKRSADIANELGIVVATVEVHRRNIRHKLGLQTIADLTRYAINHGLITSSI